jgi:hypothetical protein
MGVDPKCSFKLGPIGALFSPSPQGGPYGDNPFLYIPPSAL